MILAELSTGRFYSNDSLLFDLKLAELSNGCLDCLPGDLNVAKLCTGDLNLAEWWFNSSLTVYWVI